jgi:hypothetical protein
MVVRFTCNICGKTAEPLTADLGNTPPRKVAPPKEWAEVVGVDKRRSLDIQLCLDCTTAIKTGQVVVQNKTSKD